jgi:hypothetical protein
MLNTRGAGAWFDKVAAQCRTPGALAGRGVRVDQRAPTCRRGFFARGSSATAWGSSDDFRLV